VLVQASAAHRDVADEMELRLRRFAAEVAAYSKT
jgi:hypothetical protein